LHLYFQAPAETALRNTVGEGGRGLGWKVDTRAHGGYVVGARSVVPGKGVYRVVADREPAALPAWLVQRLSPAPLPAPPAVPIRPGSGQRDRYVQAAIAGETAKVLDAPTHHRNTALYLASVALGQLVAGGALAEAEATAALLSAASKHITLGVYSPRQAHQTIFSGLRAGANRPRQVAA
jgi:hypothetical protein